VKEWPFYNLNTATVSMAHRIEFLVMTATYFREDGDEYSVVVRFDEESRNSISDIESLLLQIRKVLKFRFGRYWRS
jgi:multidrug efflux pump subunit AcrB